LNTETDASDPSWSSLLSKWSNKWGKKCGNYYVNLHLNNVV
jgi:hypothetical protein